MIYNTFNDIERPYGYAQEYLQEARNRAVHYLDDITYEVGSVGVKINGELALLTQHQKHAVFYYKIGQMRELNVLGVEELYDICKQVREKHLVLEYGDPIPEEPEKAEQP